MGDRLWRKQRIAFLSLYPFAFGDAPKVQGVRGNRLWIAFGKRKQKNRWINIFALQICWQKAAKKPITFGDWFETEDKKQVKGKGVILSLPLVIQ